MIQQDFYDAADAGYNIFLTGIGGSGKSYALKNWCERQNKKIVVTAPTGIAAINAGGTTIHKAFQVSGDNYIKVNNQDIDWKEVDVLIIDEISMVSCELLDYIDRILRTFRTSMLPFGGMQVILVGDLAQLEPVYNLNDENTKKRYDNLIADKGSTYFVVADSYIGGKFKQITLTENKRSVDDKLNNLLNKVREGDLSVLSQFKRILPREDLSQHVHIFPYNMQVDKMNGDMLAQLTGENKCYYGFIEGNFNESNCISPKYLDLKVGAKIMITKNLDCGLVNGDMGTVVSMGDSYIKIFSYRFQTIHEITIATWENKVYDHHGEEEIIGKYMQMPLKLGYAITAHKCISGDQLIKGTQGLFKISTGKVGDMVYTANGIYPIIGKQYMGTKDTLKITTKTGLELVATKDHRILSVLNSREEYIESGKLSIGDKLIINRDIREGGKDIELIPAQLSSKSKNVIYPDYIDNDFSYYIGLLIGDGSYNYKKDGRLDIESQDIEITNFLNQFYNKLNINLLIKPKKYSKSKSHIVTSKNLRDTLFNVGLNYVTGKDKSIPDCFLEMNIEKRGQLLSGLFDTDGHMSLKGVIKFTTTSNKLVKQMQLMLLDMGIISFIKTMKVYSNKHNQSYQLHITGNNIILFQKYIGFKIGYKNQRLTDYINSGKLKGKTNIDWIVNVDEIKTEFKNFFKSTGYYIKGDGYTSDKKITSILYLKNLSYTHLIYLNDFAIKKGVHLPILNKTLKHNYFYDEIYSIEENGETDVYDLEIETEHSFVAQGIVVHNCQGLTLDKVCFHYSPSLSRNLIYVALSRATTYDGLLITSGK